MRLFFTVKRFFSLPLLMLGTLLSFQWPEQGPGSPDWAGPEAGPIAAPRAQEPAGETRPTVLEGRVLGPDGAPAEGAVVVSTAGGKAVTDAAGDFRLEVELSIEVREVQVTAVQGGSGPSLTASVPVAVPFPGAFLRAGTMKLQAGSACQPEWLPTFGEAPGVNGQIRAMAVYDDGAGGGPALHIGGSFTIAGGVAANRVAKWDGSSWSPLRNGVNDTVWSMTVHDDGTGPALYIGGIFTTADGVSAERIARWDGTSWSGVGGGVDGVVQSFAVFDSGAGPALYVGGSFTMAGGTAVGRIAKWDGMAWSGLGSGMNAWVSALGVYDDGAGPALYAGGVFVQAGGVSANGVAKWDGASWSAPGSGVSGGTLPCVFSLAVFDDGSGPGLYAGGRFTHAGGVNASRIAKWDGTSWSSLGAGVDSNVTALMVHDDGGGPALFVGGGFTHAGGAIVNSIAKWDGALWSPVGSGFDGGAYPFVGALNVIDEGAGPVLYAGGSFESSGEVTANGFARWDGASWSAPASGLNGTVYAQTVYDDGGGPALYAGGLFTAAGDVNASRIAKWDGTSWSALGAGIEGGPVPTVRAMTMYDDGRGPALYAGGAFGSAGGVSANRIAKWNGGSWSALGLGLGNNWVDALATYDDGGGLALYVGGAFWSAGGVSASRIAKWDGTSWSELGSGTNNTVAALTVFDDGGSAELIAGGFFTDAGGVNADRIAKWDGSSWSALGSGMDGPVRALTTYDDGGGPALIAGGWFTSAGGVRASGIAKWDGVSWAALGSGMNGVVQALAVYDDGGGSALYASGGFTSAGGVSASGIAKWDGTTWSALGNGVNGVILALTVHDDARGSGPSLCAGGGFTVSSSADSYLARWGGCAAAGVGYCFGDGGGFPCPCNNTGGTGQGCANSTGTGVVLAAGGSSAATADDL